jgi:alanine dehydrogenase
MTPPEILVISPQEVRDLLTMDECIVAVESAFRLYGEGKAVRPGVLSTHTADGGFHIKAGLLDLGRAYFAAKVNGNFPDNPFRASLSFAMLKEAARWQSWTHATSLLFELVRRRR